MNLIWAALITLFCSGGFILYSQPSTDFGKIDPNDFNFIIYDKDPIAEAVVIYDIGELSFRQNHNNDFDIVLKRRTKIKILNEGGIKWCEVIIPLYQNNEIYEKVEKIKGITINIENDKFSKHELNPANIYMEKINDQFVLAKYAMPAVKKGSVIEFMYTVSTPYIYKLPDWRFQWGIPVKYSEYKTFMVPFYNYVYILQGIDRFDYQDSHIAEGVEQHYGSMTYQDVVHTYALKDIPAYRDEDFVSSREDYIIKMAFQLKNYMQVDGKEVFTISNWDELKRKLYKMPEFGGYIDKAEKKGESIIPTLNISDLKTDAKIKAIVNYVKNNYSWNGMNTYLSQQKCKELEITKKGNTAELNLLLTGMLKAAGLEVYPLLLSTRDHGKIKYDYPFIHFFNYVVPAIRINDIYILTDATSLSYDYDQVPVHCINEKGLMLNQDLEWVDLSFFDQGSSVKYHFNISFNNSMDSVICDMKIFANGYQSSSLKNKYKNQSKVFNKNYHEKGFDTNGNVVFQYRQNSLNEYTITANLKAPVEDMNDLLFITPFLKETPVENIFTQSERTNPIDLTYKQKYKFEALISLPEGYNIVYIPEEVSINNDYAILEYKTDHQQDTIIVNSLFEFKKVIYPPESYQDLRKIYGQFISTVNDKILLKKEKH